MTDKELVERLRLNANCMMDEWEPTLCKRSEFITAADRIEQLCAEPGRGDEYGKTWIAYRSKPKRSE